MDYFENNCLSFDGKDVNDVNNDPHNEVGNRNKIKSGNLKNGHKKEKPKELSCNFKAVKGRILKTVDSVYQNITSIEECRLKCVRAAFR